MDKLYIKKVLKGEVEAFSYLVRKYQDFAFSSAMAIVKDEAVAKDLVQDSFLQAFHALEKYREEASFSTWLYRIVINNCLKFLAKEKSKTKHLERLPKITILSSDSIVIMEQKELQIQLRQAIAKLPAKTAIVVQLFYLEEYSIKEIEGITPFSAANIKVLLHRGRKQLKTLLADFFLQNQK